MLLHGLEDSDGYWRKRHADFYMLKCKVLPAPLAMRHRVDPLGVKKVPKGGKINKLGNPAAEKNRSPLSGSDNTARQKAVRPAADATQKGALQGSRTTALQGGHTERREQPSMPEPRRLPVAEACRWGGGGLQVGLRAKRAVRGL
ncbi:hypothetical protein EYF80_054205 [Liparis tanakae]|uniref:Uncharacterized protein n=1 Tax=Liparis tanakae TaxID=230148 RepID=A0A4Z2F3C2_9TELE|nr:hypothetical protein EYF80_054205 [Liparis tanakae]